jgi:hypothetical protein
MLLDRCIVEVSSFQRLSIRLECLRVKKSKVN